MFEVQELDWQGRRLTVFLPPSYALSQKQYPVVYLHDGATLMMNNLNYMYRLFREGLLAELIVIGISSSSRNDDYTPWPESAATEGRADFGGRGPAYLNEIADSIKPYIDSILRTAPEPESTGMIGYSLGGLVTLLAAYRRPDVFGRFGMLSPSIWYEGMLAFTEANPLPDSGQKLYLSVGNREGVYKQNIQRHAVTCTLQAYRSLRGQLADEQRLRLSLTDGAAHDLASMSAQFPESLLWLYGAADGQQTGAEVKRAEMEAELLSPVSACMLPGTEMWDMTSLYNGLTYRIFVHLPLKPAPPEGYPVLYTVDGNAYFASLNDAMRLQTRHPRGLPSGMIVSIGYPADGPFVSERRFRDLTVPDVQQGLRPDGSPWPVNGGADAFLDFIEQELMPLIGRRYNVDHSRAALFGHSLGGFFTLYTLIRRGGLFSTYIAGSPSLWWKGKVLFDMLPELEEKLRNGELACSLMIGIGSEEDGMLENARAFYERLVPFAGSGFSRLAYNEFQGEGHMSVLQPLFSPMLRFIFAPEGAKLCI
ncbi:Ferri-bacillibactin esterase BesA [compost metagenome]